MCNNGQVCFERPGTPWFVRIDLTGSLFFCDSSNTTNTRILHSFSETDKFCTYEYDKVVVFQVFSTTLVVVCKLYSNGWVMKYNSARCLSEPIYAYKIIVAGTTRPGSRSFWSNWDMCSTDTLNHEFFKIKRESECGQIYSNVIEGCDQMKRSPGISRQTIPNQPLKPAGHTDFCAGVGEKGPEKFWLL